MTSPVYFQHTWGSIFVSETGHTHQRATADDGRPFAIICDACEPFLVKLGGVHHPAQVPPTDVEQREKERIEREGNAAMQSFQKALAENAATHAAKAPAVTESGDITFTSDDVAQFRAWQASQKDVPPPAPIVEQPRATAKSAPAEKDRPKRRVAVRRAKPDGGARRRVAARPA